MIRSEEEGKAVDNRGLVTAHGSNGNGNGGDTGKGNEENSRGL